MLEAGFGLAPESTHLTIRSDGLVRMRTMMGYSAPAKILPNKENHLFHNPRGWTESEEGAQGPHPVHVSGALLSGSAVCCYTSSISS